MSEPVTLSQLLAVHAERLGIEWPDALAPKLEVDLGLAQSPLTSLVGHMNLIRPNRIQVLGSAELAYVNALDDATADTLLELALGSDPACVIVADGLPTPSRMAAACASSGTVVLTARAPSHEVVQELAYDLSRRAARRSSVHGVFIEVMGVGVLLTGAAGVGKSELALELVSRGHRLIADDAPEFARVAPDTVEGSCPPSLRDFMEVRGLGIVNVRHLFGDSAVKPRRTLRLVIHLAVMAQAEYSPEERLQGIRGSCEILGVSVPQVSLPVAPGRNMAVLVECTVRNFILSMKGYRAAEDFADRHAAMMSGPDMPHGGENV